MHISYVLGTRPEIIKLASLIAASERDGLRFSIVHTNQHYAEKMDRIFFDELELPRAHYNLGIGSASHATQIGRMLCGIEPVLERIRPDVVVVQGDTNSALAGAMAANKLGIAVAHVEAGLRSRDRSMPEEVNRVLIDHMSDHLFCPTPLQAQILREEGLAPASIRVTGNTVADATLAHARTALRRSDILQRLGLREGAYHLLTCHRRSNTDDPQHFAALMQAVAAISEDAGVPLVFPMHPRLSSMGDAASARHRCLRAIGPVGYLDMLALQQGASLIMTDSGGIQEEACILQRKCLVLRTNTERPETLQVGGAELPLSLDAPGLRVAADALLAREVAWRNPFGDGHAYRDVLDTLLTSTQAGQRFSARVPLRQAAR
ncbi:non-hydrolyzing UDP-N-acetylglucosamine 2-epimerase [Xanthomonas rydalmerensis]|uniref:UDP-N-acetylglucosamine 2-epimerase (Non-hydrolyzing) n=1 Tax=Xanthomonas rydalmerensis TaxID=3046274 RepID=A0ABZ0JM00_9XANT|nr:UDP-N-acetylglucosamine 2-epimerase (non-hydrolyzing) [Xanthomonas sp. DM-2023]WOS40456.1 UDP-N-acetylglucosamine 2-epimerase (non-hydrolyzing) [Xanthomonas sp. DM-2023]WOS44640.1 UDP-N-acetylglucosamine 2-epimerase (non-hydrolyzing) [Xanthomonas sp. DM-2023]WOS48820.1 UDP-N-acetylglucosamine 2-epimerase (non-hydrolyzing) [Xanthomonas sp. DM-2023]WOS53000.1 UDP-N-acetylglucosamine 2-epimerase (non-hydrolyzing) [Xanthomonas sp. DM-2023]WOS57184.1 UDP-N-acetylglucosamine 2-epimerase (non-hydr